MVCFVFVCSCLSILVNYIAFVWSVSSGRHFHIGDTTATLVSEVLSRAPALKEINLGGNSLTERGEWVLV